MSVKVKLWHCLIIPNNLHTLPASEIQIICIVHENILDITNFRTEKLSNLSIPTSFMTPRFTDYYQQALCFELQCAWSLETES
jgi:hypothetical protein